MDDQPACESEVRRHRDFSEVVGHGTWQLKILAFLIVCCIPISMHYFVMTYYFTPNVEFWCSLGESNKDVNKCFLHQNGTKTPCRSWQYDQSVYKKSMISEWNLVCDKKWKADLGKAMYSFSTIIAVMVSGWASDRYGRRVVFISHVVYFLIVSLMTPTSDSFDMVLVMRFLLGFGLPPLYVLGYVIIVEVVSEKHRYACCFSFQLGWAIGRMTLPLLAWLVQEWRMLQLVLTLPWIIMLYSWREIPETPPWLILHGYTDEARKILMLAAKKNGSEAIQARREIDVLLAVCTERKIIHRETLCDLYKRKMLRKTIFTLYFAWFVIVYLFRTMRLEEANVHINSHLRIFISGVVDLMSTIVCIFAGRSIGVRRTLLVSCGFIALTFVVIIFVPNEIRWVKFAIILFGEFFSASSFVMLCTYSVEIFPTVLRNTGLGTCIVIAAISVLVAPFPMAFTKKNYTTRNIARVVFATFSIVSSLVLMFMPELKGEKKFYTLSDADIVIKKKKKKPKTTTYKFPERKKFAFLNEKRLEPWQI